MSTALGFNFDVSSNLDTSFNLYGPHGVNVQMVAAEIVPTRNGGGTLANVTFEVMDGPIAKHKFFNRINIRNPSEKAQQIGRAELAEIGNAAGVPQFSDLAQLFRRPMRATVRYEAPDEGFTRGKNSLHRFKVYNPQLPSDAPVDEPENITAPVAATTPAGFAPAGFAQPAQQPAQQAPQGFAPAAVAPQGFAQQAPQQPQQAPQQPAPMQPAPQPMQPQPMQQPAQPWGQPAPMAQQPAPVAQPMAQPQQTPIAPPSIGGAAPAWAQAPQADQQQPAPMAQPNGAPFWGGIQQ